MSSSQTADAFTGPRTLKRQPTSPRTLTSRVMTVLSFACAAIALIPLVLVLYYVVVQGVARLGPDLFTQLHRPRRSPELPTSTRVVLAMLSLEP